MKRFARKNVSNGPTLLSLNAAITASLAAKRTAFSDTAQAFGSHVPNLGEPVNVVCFGDVYDPGNVIVDKAKVAALTRALLAIKTPVSPAAHGGRHGGQRHSISKALAGKVFTPQPDFRLMFTD